MKKGIVHNHISSSSSNNNIPGNQQIQQYDFNNYITTNNGLIASNNVNPSVYGQYASPPLNSGNNQPVAYYSNIVNTNIKNQSQNFLNRNINNNNSSNINNRYV